MRPVQRDELLDYVTWTERRSTELPRILEIKAVRRVQVGPVLMFLFENRDTVRYQIEEMLRVERMVKEADIQHELSTYNELLGGPGELGCTLMVELPDPKERGEKLARWVKLPDYLYAKLPDGRKVRPRVDERQRDERKLSSVQFLKFEVGGEPPVALGCDLQELQAETQLTDEQRQALREDLSS